MFWLWDAVMSLQHFSGETSAHALLLWLSFIHTHKKIDSHTLAPLTASQCFIKCPFIMETLGLDCFMSLYNGIVIGSFLKESWWEEFCTSGMKWENDGLQRKTKSGIRNVLSLQWRAPPPIKIMWSRISLLKGPLAFLKDPCCNWGKVLSFEKKKLILQCGLFWNLAWTTSSF